MRRIIITLALALGVLGGSATLVMPASASTGNVCPSSQCTPVTWTTANSGHFMMFDAETTNWVYSSIVQSGSTTVVTVHFRNTHLQNTYHFNGSTWVWVNGRYY